MNVESFPEWARGIVWSVFGFLLAVLACGCDSGQKGPLRIGFNLWPGYEPVTLANQLGYFKKHTVRSVDFASATQVIHAVRNGAIDAAGLTLDETLLLNEDVHDVKIVLIVDISNGADVLLAKPEVASLKDLRGRRIGYEATALGAYMLSRALDTAGVRAEDVKLVAVPVDEHEKVFREGTVDAVVTFEPARSRLIATGAKVLFDSSKIPNEIMDVFVVRESYLKSNPRNVDNLLRGWFKALKYLKENREDAARRLGPRLKLSPKQVIDSYAGLVLPDLARNRAQLAGSPPPILATVKRLSDLMLKKKLLSKVVPIETLIDSGPISRVKQD